MPLSTRSDRPLAPRFFSNSGYGIQRAAGERSYRSTTLRMIWQIVGIESDVQLRAIEAKGKVDLPFGGQCRSLSQSFARVPSHLRKEERHFTPVYTYAAGAPIQREAEVTIACEGLVPARAQRAKSQITPLVVSDKSLSTSLQPGARAEDHTTFGPCLPQVHPFERRAMNNPGVAGTAGETLLDEISQVLLLQRDAIRHCVRIGRTDCG